MRNNACNATVYVLCLFPPNERSPRSGPIGAAADFVVRPSPDIRCRALKRTGLPKVAATGAARSVAREIRRKILKMLDSRAEPPGCASASLQSSPGSRSSACCSTAVAARKRMGFHRSSFRTKGRPSRAALSPTLRSKGCASPLTLSGRSAPPPISRFSLCYRRRSQPRRDASEWPSGSPDQPPWPRDEPRLSSWSS